MGGMFSDAVGVAMVNQVCDSNGGLKSRLRRCQNEEQQNNNLQNVGDEIL